MAATRKGRLARILAGGLILFFAYAAVLCVPEPFFAYSVRAGGLTLYSDRPLEYDAARAVLRLSHEKLAACPYYATYPEASIFICNSRWRQMLFFNKDYGVAGVVQLPFTGKAFLRDAAVADNRLISPRGLQVAGDRTLDYFIAHEVTHELTGRAMGSVQYHRLPQWIREGYADYVGKGRAFHYDEARQAFLAGAREMDWKQSGLYARFHLLVAYLLDHRHWTVDQLLREPWADQRQVEAEVRAEK
jgi:hypothetical protein